MMAVTTRAWPLLSSRMLLAVEASSGCCLSVILPLAYHLQLRSIWLMVWLGRRKPYKPSLTKNNKNQRE